MKMLLILFLFFLLSFQGLISASEEIMELTPSTETIIFSPSPRRPPSVTIVDMSHMSQTTVNNYNMTNSESTESLKEIAKQPDTDPRSEENTKDLEAAAESIANGTSHWRTILIGTGTALGSALVTGLATMLTRPTGCQQPPSN